MKAFLKEHSANLGLIVCEVVIGILLLISPVTAAFYILVTGGILLVIAAVFTLRAYLISDIGKAKQEHSLFKGMIELAVGLITVLKTNWIVDRFPGLPTLYGLVILLSGILKMEFAINSLRTKCDNILWLGIDSAATIVTALLIVLNVFPSEKFLWIFMGIALIIQAILGALAIASIPSVENDDKGNACSDSHEVNS